jgi:hypothetical protein
MIMGLYRTVVGFSATDLKDYWEMLTWKTTESIDFSFIDCGLYDDSQNDNEQYVKEKVREVMKATDCYALLIGEDTKIKCKYIQWEAQVAIEKGCTIIGINLDGVRELDEETCPAIIRNVGATFVAFSPQIVAYTIEHFKMKDKGNWNYDDDLYEELGYADNE